MAKSERSGGGTVRKSRCTKAKCNKCCKSFMAFLFSTVGLVIMVAAYSVAGGFLFRQIEEGHERNQVIEGRQAVENSTNYHLKQLWLITNRLNILHPDNWTAEASVVFLQYQKDVYNATVLKSWDGQTINDPVYTKWNFAGALLYAVTAITTIGYGHVTPKTPWGMASTIIYCLFGLPLTLMCIANLGKFFARVFRILYHTCCCGICCVCCLSYRKRKTANKLKNGQNFIGESADIQAVENGQSIIYTNDPHASVNRPRFMSNVTLSKAQVWMLNVKKKFSHSMKDDVTVPVYLCLVVMAVYIVFGALLFSLWDDWEYLEGAYFCFVTLTTIGFGDYVPGIIDEGGQGPDGTERLVLCSVYVILGLALIGMCIDLMQADILQKIAWLGHKLGISANSRKKADIELNVPLESINPLQITESFPSKIETFSSKPTFSASADVVEYEQETQFLNHSKQNGHHQKTRTSTNKSKKENCLEKQKNDEKVQGKLHSEVEAESVEIDGEFLCLPPPAYAEFDSTMKSSLPATPASHYDNLCPTPQHEKLQQLSTYVDPQPTVHVSQLLDKRQKRCKEKRELASSDNTTECELMLEHTPSTDNTTECELMLEHTPSTEKTLHMQMENGDDGEMMLKVSTTPQL